MLKSVARTTLLTKRQSLTEADCIKLDDLLLIQLQKLDWSTTKIIGSFYPSELHSEPNTLLFIKFLKFYIPELIVTYPKLQGKEYAMDFFQETETLEMNKWGIQEPLANHLFEPSAIDTFLVPLIGFDPSGQRIGFGKGYYDRYFARTGNSVKRIGISYFDPMPNFEDTHQFDVPLSHCITPWNTYEF
jgi:5-formyltetrahydrofolate cyclo-ligase